MRQFVAHRPRWQIVLACFAIVMVLAVVPVLGSITQASAAGLNRQMPANQFALTYHGEHYNLVASTPQPPTDQQCRQQFGSPCYSPQEMHRAYGLDPVLNAGFDGTGQSIVIVDSFGSPTIQKDLKTFDAGYGLPDPPSFREFAPLGKIKFDPSNGDMIGWAAETTLDVEWAHAMAPGANIVLMTSPVDETQGDQGMPEFLYLEQYALKHNLGKIISQSWSTTENNLFNHPGGIKILKNFETFYQQADGQGVTIFGSSGDAGVANANLNGKIYPFPTVNFPSSSPYITSVGGTSLMASIHGTYHSEVGWRGSGGGISQYFPEPAYQQAYLPPSDQQFLNGFRGLPDISYNADPNTSILIYLSFLGSSQAGYYAIGGTSEGCPQWAGIIADGNQMAGRPLGFINQALYQIAAGKAGAGSYHDVIKGNNSSHGIQGYDAGPGWDAVTGLGSPNAAKLLQQLILHT
ncbi:MAG TPA: S53 family peptidase [Ktedonobacteraceae bacterium]|nr:S53 family peptidase [Ktedonobacteraceae bacterium]